VYHLLTQQLAEVVLLLLLQAFPQLPPQLPPLGTKLLLQPGHCDPTANMYDSIVAVRGGRVVAVWPIAGRGPGL
jgi:D-serine deaminase-like pyridoxal phosphate-dependent protein